MIPRNITLPSRASVDERPLPLAMDRAQAPYVLKDPGLISAANTAVLLGQPLILAGEPGVGKTRFARKYAELCEVPMHPEVFVSTTTEGRQLLYQFDEIKRFRDGTDGRQPLASYVQLTSFGRAILWSAGPDAPAIFDPGVDLEEVMGPGKAVNCPPTLRTIFPKEFDAQAGLEIKATGDFGGAVSLTLLDEFDKAPRDAPNDLLGNVEKMRFKIEELGLTISADPKAWPILLLTSNSERSLPDAFLRRCVFYWIGFPGADLLEEIVAQHCRSEEILAGAPRGSTVEEEDAKVQEWRQSELVKTSVSLLFEIREQVVNKKPATAELLGLVSSLMSRRVAADTSLYIGHPEIEPAIGALLKTKEDLRTLGYMQEPG